MKFIKGLSKFTLYVRAKSPNATRILMTLWLKEMCILCVCVCVCVCVCARARARGLRMDIFGRFLFLNIPNRNLNEI